MTDTKPPATSTTQPALVDVKIEMTAASEMLKTLGKLDKAAQERVLHYVASAIGLPNAASALDSRKSHGQFNERERAGGGTAGVSADFATFADLYDAAGQPGSMKEKALLGGYWLQVCEKRETFPSADVNGILSQVVGPLSNVTMAFEGLRSSKPALAIQVGKSGKSQQSRKQYKLTTSGTRAVRNMLSSQ